MQNKIIRLSKIISHAGICSRREAEATNRKWKSKINGKIFKEYSIAHNKIKTIIIEGKELKKEKNRLWILINQ